MERPPESLKPFADRIARSAASSDADQLVRMLRISGLTGEYGGHRIAHLGDDERPSTITVSEPGVPQSQSKLIGIWERKEENGNVCFARRVDMMEVWHFWANVGRIEAKSSKLRVLFIGESVARGYLYDPGFTPALALQMILEEHYG